MSTDKAAKAGGGRVREMLTPRRIAALVLCALALVFIFENTQRVKIRLIVPEVKMPLWLALLITFVVGGVCTLLWRWSGRRRARRAMR
ncbi:lipopolysaccharide assembly protein LapA domain-containing protein [Streptomyces sp. NPDC087270]|uniref:lipopolysaccharide assembly protein LapA domain-containing protein n=1 Tax=Streptomyces sp. NPDC087270 TaxID=3365774 RepID=UPI00381AB85D